MRLGHVSASVILWMSTVRSATISSSITSRVLHQQSRGYSLLPSRVGLVLPRASSAAASSPTSSSSSVFQPPVFSDWLPGSLTFIFNLITTHSQVPSSVAQLSPRLVLGNQISAPVKSQSSRKRDLLDAA